MQATYEGSDEVIANPDRGVIAFHGPEGSNDGTEWQGPLSAPETRDYLETLQEDTGATTVRVVYDIRDYVDEPLSDEMLQRIEDDFDTAREMGYKVAPQFTYGWVEDQQSDAAEDADADQILEHLDQLAPVLEENTDVMSFMYAGFIGPWGEWHSSTAGNLDENDQVNDATREIYDGLMEAVPEEDFVALRYPVDLRELTDETPVTAEEAFGPSDEARTGLYDDGFLQNVYEDEAQTEEGRAYREALGQYTPSIENLDLNLRDPGGEMLEGDEVLEELESRGSDHITDTFSWDPAVEDGDATFDAAALEVGYRFRLVSTELSDDVSAGGTLDYEFVIANDGYSAPYTERPVEIVLVGEDGTEVALPLDADPRLWEGGETQTLSGSVELPDDMPPGTHEAHLAFPDAHESIVDDPRYAIRLANEDVWEAETGYNDLGLEVSVEAAGHAADPDPVGEPEVIGTSGTVEITQADAGSWTRVEFGTELEGAVVVLGPPTSNGGQPTSVRVRDVDETGFEMQLDEWAYLDGFHVAEEVSWMAVEAGTHTLGDGRTIQAGTAEAGGAEGGAGWTEVALDDAYTADTAVFATVTSPDDADALAPRLRDVKEDAFEFRLDAEEAARTGGAKGATSGEAGIDWIAVERGPAQGDGGLEVGDAGGVDHDGGEVAYEAAYDEDPVLLASMQTTNGGDTATLRTDGRDADGAGLRVEEERSRDDETRHAQEDIAYLATQAGPIDGWTEIA